MTSTDSTSYMDGNINSDKFLNGVNQASMDPNPIKDSFSGRKVGPGSIDDRITEDTRRCKALVLDVLGELSVRVCTGKFVFLLMGQASTWCDRCGFWKKKRTLGSVH